MTNYSGQTFEAVYRDDLGGVSGRGSHKFYRVTVIQNDAHSGDYRVLFQWGRVGATGQSSLMQLPTQEQAYNVGQKKINEKLGKGYVTKHGWEDLREVPQDLLMAAGINTSTPTVVGTPVEISLPAFAAFTSEVGRVRRLAMGSHAQCAQAIVERTGLREQLKGLQDYVTRASGELDFVEDVIAMQMER